VGEGRLPGCRPRDAGRQASRDHMLAASIGEVAGDDVQRALTASSSAAIDAPEAPGPEVASLLAEACCATLDI
jgi:hypothetical protein